MERRDTAFQKLKPLCVALSEATLVLNGPRGDTRTVTDRLEALRTTLASVTHESDALDVKLADYVFFPISNALKFSQRLPVRSLELAIQCVDLLISHGWRERLQPQLASQLVILCTLLAENDSKGLSFSTPTDELRAGAFSCLFHIFSILGLSAQCRTTLTSEASFPQLGHTVSVLLKGIGEGSSFEPQIAATRALNAFIENVQDRELNASFLPGIASKLSRVLTPDTRFRRNHRVLVGCLDILGQLIRSTLSDAVPQSPELRDLKTTAERNQSKSIIDAEWQKAAASELQLAFNYILRLRDHSREDVQYSLGSLCLILLRDCRKSLSNLSPIALKSLLSICARSPLSTLQEQVYRLVYEPVDSQSPSFLGLLQNTLFDLVQSLPTVMQGSDDTAKVGRLQQIGVAHDLLSRSDDNTTALDRLLAEALRDCVVLTIAQPERSDRLGSFVPAVQSLDLMLPQEGHRSAAFSSPLVKYRGQEDVMNAIESLTKSVISTRSSTFADEFSRALDTSENDSKVANFWLLFTTLRDTLKRTDGVDSMLDFGNDTSSACQIHLEYLYGQALAILNTGSDDETGDRLTALALRTLALRAETAGKDFRYELVDALYPVLHSLATPNEQLQGDSIATLDIIASTCEYRSVEDLLVQNSDYLTDAVALKLNDFDVSPQAPQVLLMMLRLAGPSLLPYMEDTVQSIFSALEDYHGYPLLVELLFRVLRVMAEEGVKNPKLAIAHRPADEIKMILQGKWQPTSPARLATMLQERAEDERGAAKAALEDAEKLESHPEKPWKSILEDDDSDDSDEEAPDADDLDTHGEDAQLQDTETPTPVPKTYSLLLRITELTRHFLPAASPALRTSLLGLIKTTTPAIAKHENSFLPLINTLWPEIVSRLDDTEPYVVASTLDIVGILCEYAGDFMRTRITALWPRLFEIYSSTSAEILRSESGHKSLKNEIHHKDKAIAVHTNKLTRAVERMEAHTADYADTMNRHLWSALTNAISMTVAHVSLSPELFDEALQMLIPVLRHPRIRDVLTRENADALWLAELKIHTVEEPQLPRVPVDKSWRFVLLQRW